MEKIMFNMVRLVCTLVLCASAADASEVNMNCEVSYKGIHEAIVVAPGKIMNRTAGDFGTLNFQNYEGGTMVLFLDKPGLSLQVHSGDAALTLPNPKGNSGSLTLRCILTSI